MSSRAVLVLSMLSLVACAKTREEQKPEPAASAPPRATAGVTPTKLCRYESGIATSSLDVAGVVALDLPQDKVRAAVTCSGGGLQECAGTIAAKHEPVKGEATFALSVDQRGQVSDAKVEKDGGIAPDVTSCVTTILKKLDMPDGDKSQTTVRVTLRFAPQDPGSSPRFAGIKVEPHVTVTAGRMDGADKAIAGALGRARGCYVLGLEGDDKLAGTASYTLTVGAGGEVTDEKVTQRGNLTPAVLDCLGLVMHSIKLPAPEGGKGAITGSWDLGRAGH